LSFCFTRWFAFALVFERLAGADTLCITLVIDCVRVFVVTLCSSFLDRVRTSTGATHTCSDDVALILCSTFYFYVCAHVATFAYAGTIAFIINRFKVVVVALGT
jgi:hypothetical protein